MLASVGSVGDAYDNAMAESFVDSFKTELIADRVWRARSQIELATVEYVGWFNHNRLHEALGDLPPAEFEALHAAHKALERPIPDDRSAAAIVPRPLERLPAPRIAAAGEPTGRNGADHCQPAGQAAARVSLRSPPGSLRSMRALTPLRCHEHLPNPQNQVSAEPGPAQKSGS